MKEYTDKRVLVTGGTGFIGSRLAERLALEEQAVVKVLVHNWPKATWISRANVTLIQGDITNFSDVEKAIEGMEIVFHCVGVGGTLEHCMKVNVEGTKNVLNACKKYNVKRIVYFSTSAIHGSFVHEGLNEKEPYKSEGNPYADSKIEAEKLFIQFIKENEVEGTIIRPTYVWGPCSPWYTVEFVNLMQNGKFFLIDRGKGACNVVYIDNVVDLALICGYHSRAKGEIFLITDGERIVWRDFFSYYADIVKIDINKLPSFGLGLTSIMKQKIGRITKSPFILFYKIFNNYIKKHDNADAIIIKYLFKAPRRLNSIIISLLNKIFPDRPSQWELDRYSSNGFINLEKSKELLNYIPKVSVSQGMNVCEIWLRDQNYLISMKSTND